MEKNKAEKQNGSKGEVDATKLAPKAANAAAQPDFYIIPAKLLDEVLGFIAQGPWIKVNDLVTRVSQGVKPITKTKVTDEAEN